MILQLFRQYEETRTLGLIKMDGKIISKTLENSRNFKTPCMKEGKYQLFLHYSEKMGWYVALNCPGATKYTFTPLRNGEIMPERGIFPVLYWNKEAKFSKLATLHLMEKLEASFESGDQLWLEISEYTKQLSYNDRLVN
jgi:hypothetical protein